MGQQQLILLVLATVIVGIAIVVGIAAFTENSARSNADAMMQDAVRIANDAQAAVKKPAPFGGVDALTDVDFGIIGYPNEGGFYANLNGAFEITPITGGIRITGYGGNDVVEFTPGDPGPPVVPPSWSVVTANVEQQVEVTVCGLSDQAINGAIMLIGGDGTGATQPTC